MKNIIIVAIITLILLGGICCDGLKVASFKNEIARYDGEGEIHDISFRYLLCKIKGYEIEFPDFPLDKPISLSYNLSNLPILEESPYIFFNVTAVKEKQDIGKITITVTGAEGNILTQLTDANAKDLIWSSESGNQYFHLYHLDKSTFTPKRSEKYILKFKLVPNIKLNSGVGSVYIRCGGHI